MKIQAGDARSFLRDAPLRVAAVLLYGNDQGLVSERARALARMVVPDADDPFRESAIDGELLESEPARLAEEAQALCLMGGRRVVRVRNVRERGSKALELLLGLDPIEGFCVLEAAELPASSRLRQIAERSAKAAAIGCWHDEGRELGATIRDGARDLGLAFDPDAMAYLMEHLGGDRLVTRSELEKLALYLGDAEGGTRRVGLAEVTAVVGDSSALAMDELVLAALDGDQLTLERHLSRLLAAGEVPFRLVRALAGAALRHARILAAVTAERRLDAVIANHKPAIHFRARPKVTAILKRLDAQTFLAILEMARQCELDLKRAGSPAELLVRRLFFETAARASTGRRVPGGRAVP